ncbi:MAG: CHAT domain-containing protein [Thermoleophilia bacterium]
MNDARERGNAAAEATALRARAWAEREVFDYDAAVDTLARASTLARRIGMAELDAELSAMRASMCLERGSPARARRHVTRARRVLGGASTPNIDLQDAVIEDAAGHLDTAVKRYRHVLDRYAELPPETAFTVHNNLGVILGQIGDVAAADRHLLQAEQLGALVGRSTYGFAVHNHAVLATRSGDLSGALRRFDDAEAVFREIGFPLAEHYMERIEALLTLNLLRDAAAIAGRALDELDRADGRMLRGEVRLAHARVLLARGAPAEAALAADRAAQELARTRGAVWHAHAQVLAAEARRCEGTATGHDLRRMRRAAPILAAAGFHLESTDARLLVGRLLLARGRRAEALDGLAGVARLSRSRIPLVRLKARLASALAGQAEHRRDRITRAAREGLDELERLRQAIPTQELRARASVHGVELASLGLRAALERGRAGEVLEWMERGRQASTLAVPGAGHDPGVATLLGELREVMARRRGADSAGPEDASRLAREQSVLEARLQRSLRRQADSPGARRPLVRAPALADALDDRVLIELAEADGQLVAALFGRRIREVHRLAAAAVIDREVETIPFAMRRLCRAPTAAGRESARRSLDRSLAALNALIVEPLIDAIGTTERIVVAPIARLFGVPWHALPGFAGRRVTAVPSATAWMRFRDLPQAGGTALAVAGPELGSAAEEVRSVAGLHRSGVAMVPPDSTVDAVIEAMAAGGLLHLACHGEFRSDNPSFSALHLADGPLTVLDLERLGRAPAVVVLAACDAAASEALPGDELRGFLSALFMLGTRSVIASTVPVPDLESTGLMTELHRGLSAGLDSERALDAARAGLDADDASVVLSVAYAHFGEPSTFDAA